VIAAVDAVTVREQQGSRIDDGRPIQLAPRQGIRAFGPRIKALFPATYGPPQVRAPSNTHNPALPTRDLHEEARAIDFAVRSYDLGDRIANFLSLNAQSLGVQGVLWRRTAWFSSRPPGQRFHAYTGMSPHTRHVHVEIGPDFAGRSLASLDQAFNAALPPPPTGNRTMTASRTTPSSGLYDDPAGLILDAWQRSQSGVSAAVDEQIISTVAAALAEAQRQNPALAQQASAALSRGDLAGAARMALQASPTLAATVWSIVNSPTDDGGMGGYGEDSATMSSTSSMPTTEDNGWVYLVSGALIAGAAWMVYREASR
jgi:hypothetical protein